MKKVEFICYENGHIKTEHFYCCSFAVSDIGVAFVIDGCDMAAFLHWDEMPKDFIGFTL